MLLCRFQGSDGPQPGVIDHNVVYTLQGDYFSPEAVRAAHVAAVEDVILLPPVVPSKIICVGRNYAEHAQELGNEVPAEPLLFFKPPSSLIGPGAPIEILPHMGRVDHEAELAVVIGRRGRFIPVEHALEYVLGYCCANDVSDRDFQKKDNQWARAKGFDTFCPLGPWIDTALDPANVAVRCRVNGEPRQEGRTSHLVFSVLYLIAHISGIMTLEPGDIILTGTPAGVGPIKPGDHVEVEVEGLGRLGNPVVAGG